MGSRESIVELYALANGERASDKEFVQATYQTMLDQVKADWEESIEAGVDKIATHRTDWYSSPADLPDRDLTDYNQMKKEMKKFKTILLDKSSTREGAEETIRNLEEKGGVDLSNGETVLLLKALGELQRHGVVTRNGVSQFDSKQIIQDIKRILENPSGDVESLEDYLSGVKRMWDSYMPSGAMVEEANQRAREMLGEYYTGDERPIERKVKRRVKVSTPNTRMEKSPAKTSHRGSARVKPSTERKMSEDGLHRGKRRTVKVRKPKI